jgi:hypothetical protein
LVVERGWTEAELANRVDYGSIQFHAVRLDDFNITCLAVFADVELQHDFCIGRNAGAEWDSYASGVDNLGGNYTGAYWAGRG